MATDKQLQHIMDLAKRRKLTPRPIAKSEAAMTDAARLKREMEAQNAAVAWQAGMAREKRE